MTMLELDLQELTEQGSRPNYPDVLSEAVGSDVYVRRHEVPDTVVRGPAGIRYKLVFSRYYWGAATMVDFKREVGSDVELKGKRLYCEREGLRYFLLEDEYDLEPFEPAHGMPIAAVPPTVGPAREQPRRRNAKASG